MRVKIMEIGQQDAYRDNSDIMVGITGELYAETEYNGFWRGQFKCDEPITFSDGHTNDNFYFYQIKIKIID